MDKYSGYEYMLIDLANAYGMDKELFGPRITAAQAMLDANDDVNTWLKADNKPQFAKTLLTLRRVLKGEPTGHLMGLDACCSGIQIMSALTGCITGATNTGLVDPNIRADAYGILATTMQQELGAGFTVERGPAKDALMTVFYGSKEQPKKIFGADTPELNVFYIGAQAIAPGAWQLLQDLLASWQPWALYHAWKLPDGFDARVKVMSKQSTRIEVDELDHATFTYEWYDNVGTEKGLSNVANVVHSVDAYVVRCIHRRCNYDRTMVDRAWELIGETLATRGILRCGHTQAMDPAERNQKVQYYIAQWERSGMADVVILPYLTEESVREVPSPLLHQLKGIARSMLAHAPFSVVTIHDEFKCSPNDMNHLRQHYINIFAELAESHLLSDILSQLHGSPGTFQKLSTNLPQLIRGSNYALS